MLAHVLDRLAAFGVPRVVVNAHHRVEDVRAFAVGHPELFVSEEAELLGTAGGVARVADRLGPGPVLVWNADVLIDVDLAALTRAHVAGPPREATLVVRRRADGQGSVGLDEAGRIVRLREERVAREVASADFASVHVLGDDLRAHAPPRGCLVGDLYIPAMRRGAGLHSFEYQGPVLDVGNLQTYLEANLAWLGAQRIERWIHPSVSVSGAARVLRAVVGEGATLGGRGTIERTVVWPGGAAVAPLTDAVVTPDRVVFLR
jgi:mannose-1-phosphate guanylyltransferase